MEPMVYTGACSGTLAAFLEEEHTGSLLMVNSAGIYLQLDGQILLLCHSRWGQVPIGIGMGEFDAFARTASPADPVASRGGCLHFPSGWVKINIIEPEPLALGVPSAERWQQGIGALENREKGLVPLASRLLLGKNGAESPLCALAGPRLEALCRAITRADVPGMEAETEKLLGLGPGLTPSADDVLCGLIYGLIRSKAAEHPGVLELRKILCRLPEGRTHPVSAAYLKAVAGGAHFSRMEGAWRFLTDRDGEGYAPLLEVGGSSGSDMLLGLLLAGKLLLRMEEWTDV